jgi:5-(carboxyamino)imidazole ribonucleotide synthase
LEAANRQVPVFPTPDVHAAAGHRVAERKRLDDAGLPQTAHAVVEDEASLAAAIETVGLPAVMKIAGQGYDGKGQIYARTAEELQQAFAKWNNPVCVLEAAVDLATELSVLVVTGRDGQRCVYEPVENVHRKHILDHSLVPARISEAQHQAAIELAEATADAFATPGLICVEMFLTTGGELLVNEIAPRPHNSGHLTVEAHQTSQYEQLVRALCGLPLGSIERPRPAAMVNLLGDWWADGEPQFSRLLEDPRISLCLYGKQRARPGRKMGHFVAVCETREAAEQAIDDARQRLAEGRHDSETSQTVGRTA